ncbi:MAG: hypothetical protein IKX51_01560 [Bacteroidales bacterium]|nr:hypothetical protein [Bacteroidales bacterium]
MCIVLCTCLAMTIVACSPSHKGEKLGKKYCEVLKGYEKFETPSQFKSLKDSAMTSVRDEYNELMQSFADDSTKLNEFLAAYNTAVAEGSADFSTAYEKSIQSFFKDNAWYREKDPNKYFLYSFADDSLNVLNCVGKIAYRLHCDTIFFADTNHTTAIVDIIGDTILSLTSAADTNYASTYRIAQFEDLIRGTWTYRPMQNYYGQWKSSWTNWKENGRYVGQEWQYNDWSDNYRLVNTSGTYKFKQVNDTTYNLITDNGRNGVNGKIVMNGVDKFRHYYSNGTSELKSRSKKGAVKSLDCLFEEKKTAEPEVAEKK